MDKTKPVQEYLRSELVGLAQRLEPEALLARVRDRKQRTGSRLAAERILEHRDHARR